LIIEAPKKEDVRCPGMKEDAYGGEYEANKKSCDECDIKTRIAVTNVKMVPSVGLERTSTTDGTPYHRWLLMKHSKTSVGYVQARVIVK